MNSAIFHKLTNFSTDHRSRGRWLAKAKPLRPGGPGGAGWQKPIPCIPGIRGIQLTCFLVESEPLTPGRARAAKLAKASRGCANIDEQLYVCSLFAFLYLAALAPRGSKGCVLAGKQIRWTPCFHVRCRREGISRMLQFASVSTIAEWSDFFLFN